MTARTPTGKTYPRIRQAENRQELDRGTWAGNTLTVVAYDTVGRGIIQTGLIDFGLVYEDAPFFAYGVELAPGQALIEGDYPEVTVGVRQWQTSAVESDTRAKLFYLGAYLWISINALSSYRLRFRLSFEGITMRNVEYFRGLNG